jgi:acetyl-CoA carboxylase carboxyl transferase subunit alpha
MLEHSVYSVISPEGCAAILWKKNGAEIGQGDYEKASDALKMTAQNLHGFGVIDEIIPEPLGGAHRNPEETAERVRNILQRELTDLMDKPIDSLLEERYQKFKLMGALNQEKVP